MKLPLNKIKEEKFLKDKKLLLATWACGDKDIYQCRDWIPLFKKMFGKLIIFPIRNHYYFYGKNSLNSKLLDLIEKEKPDYLLFGHRYNEIEIETIRKIKKISPNIKTIIVHGDDDFRFDDWGRYYALFFDYVITLKKETEIYANDNLYNFVSIQGVSPDFFKPMNLEKKYDVTFIGTPIVDRPEYIRFLKENGIKVKLFGVEWQNYPDLKEIYEGILYDENYPKVINESKINLNFSKTLYKKGKSGQLKARVLEVPACGAFLLNEYTKMNLEFINKKKEINFKNKEELLEKVKYYLKHEKEREKIAKEVYDYIVKYHSWDILFSDFFKRIDKDKPKSLILPEIDKKIAKISLTELNKTPLELKKILSGIDYVLFNDSNSLSLEDRDYLQAYSLFISKKQISCCDYYVNSELLGDYLLFKSKDIFNTLNNEFYNFLNVNQLMITKKYFLNNLNSFKRLSSGIIDSEIKKKMSDENIVFVSIPLIRVKNIPKFKYSQLKEVFYLSFFDDFFPLIYQKKFLNSYMLKLILFSLKGNYFIIKSLFEKFSSNFNKTILKSLGFLK
jgi:hypothetical protein